jgi:hypothetical protein
MRVVDTIYDTYFTVVICDTWIANDIYSLFKINTQNPFLPPVSLFPQSDLMLNYKIYKNFN